MRGAQIILVVFSILILGNTAFSQIDSVAQQPETTRTAPPQAKPPITPLRKIRSDTVLRAATPPAITDSAALKQRMLDSLVSDSLRQAAAKVPVRKIDTSTYKKYEPTSYLPRQQPVFRLIDRRLAASKDDLFYLMAGVVFCLAFIRAGFPKYFRNLFVVFFQTNIRQKQTRDQLLQDNFASLLINLLFFISAGLYITLLIRYHEWSTIPFWILTAASVGALLVIYFGKYLFLRFSGWVFNAREAAGSYIFMVFLVNKVMGIFLVPILLLLSFSSAPVVKVALTVSFGLVGLMFAYRYFVSFNAIRSRLKVNVFHFFLYLCAVEVLPLLLIYKLLISYFAGSF